MVMPTRRSTRGASSLGCLFSILVLMAILYYGIDIGRVYWNYYKLIDEMGTSARFAETQTDDQILKHLVGVTQDLGLPAEARRFTIKRGDHPKTVTISTKYTVVLELPFKRKQVVLTPSASERQF
jgi:hypothetical protein